MATGKETTRARIVTTSAGAADEGKVPVLNGSGVLDESILPVITYPNLKTTLTAGEVLTAGDPVILSDGTSDTQVVIATDIVGTYNIEGNNWCAQTFTAPAGATYLTSITFNGVRSAASDSTMIASIRETSAGLPTGTDIDGSTGNAVVSTTPLDFLCTLSTPVPVVPGTVYAIVMRVGSYGINIRYDSVDVYAGGNRVTSSNAGSNWSAVGGDFVTKFNYSSTEAGKLYKTDASADDEYANNFIGFADANISADADGVITIAGIDANQTGLTPGAKQYLSDTPGEISESAGSQSRLVGRALSATEIKIINDF